MLSEKFVFLHYIYNIYFYCSILCIPITKTRKTFSQYVDIFLLSLFSPMYIFICIYFIHTHNIS